MCAPLSLLPWAALSFLPYANGYARILLILFCTGCPYFATNNQRTNKRKQTCTMTFKTP